MSEQVVTILSIGKGALPEMFQHELDRVLKNIADVNTSAKAKRTINIKIEIKPDEDRGLGFTTLEVSSKLAALKPVESTVYFGKKDGQPVAVTNDFTQQGIFDNPDEKSNITPMTAIAGGKAN